MYSYIYQVSVAFRIGLGGFVLLVHVFYVQAMIYVDITAFDGDLAA